MPGDGHDPQNGRYERRIGFRGRLFICENVVGPKVLLDRRSYCELERSSTEGAEGVRVKGHFDLPKKSNSQCGNKLLFYNIAWASGA